MTTRQLGIERVAKAKRAFTTRRVDVTKMRSLICGNVRPRPGDLVLARVDEIGNHTRIELTDGRRAYMFPGDEIIVCFGNRYAPDQFEAVIGVDLASCHLVAAGGIASRELSRHQRMLEPTKITPIGLVGDSKGNRLNVRDFRLSNDDGPAPIPVILSLGTSMNAGKTLSAMSLVRGFKAAGLRVAAIKATGTGAGGDMWIVRDAGADVVLDFTDAGFASTYLAPIDEIKAGAHRLLNHAAEQGCEIAVIEIADGLQQLETSELVQSDTFGDRSLGVVFASYDAMGAKCGVDMLRAAGHEVLALSGRLARSPLGVREAEMATGLRVYTPDELQEGALNALVRERAAAIFAASGFHADYLKPLAFGSGIRSDGVVLWNHQAPANDTNSIHLVSLDGSPTSALPTQAQAPGPLAEGMTPKAGMSGGSASDQRLIEVLGLVAQRLMDAEAAALCGAMPGVRSSERTNRRNGVRRRVWKSGLGEIALKVPRLRRGGYHPAFLINDTISLDDVRAVLDSAQGPSGSGQAVARLLRALGTGGLPEGVIGALGAEIAVQLAGTVGRPNAGPEYARVQPGTAITLNRGSDWLEQEDLAGELEDEKIEHRVAIAGARRNAYEPVTEYAASAGCDGIDPDRNMRMHESYEAD